MTERLHGLGEVEHRMDVHLERRLPFLVAYVADVLEGGLMSRVVDQDVDATQSSSCSSRYAIMSAPSRA